MLFDVLWSLTVVMLAVRETALLTQCSWKPRQELAGNSFKQRSFGIMYCFCHIFCLLWKFLSVVGLISNFSSKKVSFTENVPVKWNSATLVGTINGHDWCAALK